MPTFVPAKKNTQLIFYVSLISQANTKIAQANPTLAAGDVKVATDDAAPANLGTLPVVDADFTKRVKVTLSAAEMNGDNATVIFADAAGAEWCDLTVNIQTVARQIDDLAFPNVTARGIDVDATGGVEITPNQAVNAAQWAGAATATDDVALATAPTNFAALSITAAGLVDITQAAADKVWASATRTLTSFGTLVADVTNAVWDELVAEVRVAASYGQKLKDLVLTAGRVDIGQWLGVAVSALVAGRVPSDLQSIDGGLTTGNNATLNLKQLNIVNSAGDAIVASATGANGRGINASGDGTGPGIRAKGGATGQGVLAEGGATSGSGFAAKAAAGSSHGIEAEGKGAGSGIDAFSPGPGIKAESSGSFGVRMMTTAAGINAVAVDASGVGNADGLSVQGVGTGAGFRVNGNALTFTIANKVDASIQAAGDFAQAAADKVWSSATRTLTAFSTALAVSVWDVLETAILVASSIGLKVKTNLDAAVSTRSSHSAADVWTVATRTLTAFSFAVDLSATALAAIWDRLTSALVTVGSVGKLIVDNLDAAITTRLAPTVAGRTLDIAVGGEAGVDLDNTVGALAKGTEITGFNDLSAAQVNAEVVDALNVDTYAEPGQEAPPATTTLVKKIGYLYKAFRNRFTQDATTFKLHGDDGTTVDQKAAVSDDGVTFDRSEIGAGP